MRQLLLTNNTCYKRNVDKADSRYTTFQARGPKGIMMHSTGADNPTLKRYIGPDDGVLGTNIYGNHWNNPGLDVCVHAFIGETKNGTVECYQTLPWNFRGWHCGAEANDTHISIEICEDDLTSPAYFRATRNKALDVVSDLCLEFGFDPLAKGVLIDHHEGAAMGIASNHGDVAHCQGPHHPHARGDDLWGRGEHLHQVRPENQDQNHQHHGHGQADLQPVLGSFFTPAQLARANVLAGVGGHSGAEGEVGHHGEAVHPHNSSVGSNDHCAKGVG